MLRSWTSCERRPREALHDDEPAILTGALRKRFGSVPAVDGVDLSIEGGTSTVLLTTQYLEEADRLADRIAVMDQGRVIAEGTPAELKARMGSTVIEIGLMLGGPTAQPVSRALAWYVALLMAAAGIAVHQYRRRKAA